MNDCAPYEDLLSARLDGTLTPWEAEELRDHLATCPHCRRYGQDLQALHRSLGSLSHRPPEQLTDTILTGLEPQPAPAKKPPRRWAPLVCAAALALAILGGVPLLSQDAFSGGALGETAVEGSTAEDTAPKESAPEPVQDNGSSTPLLTQADALDALKTYLDTEDRNMEPEPLGLSDDGGRWLFSARNSAGTAARFSVDRRSGAVEEIPGTAPF